MLSDLAIYESGHSVLTDENSDRTSVGNPVEGERDSGLKPNTIPLGFLTAFRSEGEHRSGGKANTLGR